MRRPSAALRPTPVPPHLHVRAPPLRAVYGLPRLYVAEGFRRETQAFVNVLCAIVAHENVQRQHAQPLLAGPGFGGFQKKPAQTLSLRFGSDGEHGHMRMWHAAEIVDVLL